MLLNVVNAFARQKVNVRECFEVRRKSNDTFYEQHRVVSIASPRFIQKATSSDCYYETVTLILVKNPFLSS